MRGRTPERPRASVLARSSSKPRVSAATQRFTHATGVAADYIQLQFASRSRVNVFGGKTPHARGHTVDHLLLRDDLLHPGARFLHRGAGAWG